MMKIIDIASCMIFPALYSTSQVCSVIFSSVAPRTKLYAPYNSKKYGWICLRSVVEERALQGIRCKGPNGAIDWMCGLSFSLREHRTPHPQRGLL